MMDIMTSQIHLQTYLAGRWHDAVAVTFAAEELGHRGPTTLDYEIDYCLAQDSKMTGSVSGVQTVSVASKAALLARLPDRARKLGVAPDVVDRAMGRCQELAKTISGIADGADHAPA